MNDAVDPDLLLAEGRALRALARCLVGEADADDVVHDAQLALLRTRATARQAGPWLAGTVRKLAAMLRRGDARRRMRELAVARDEVDAAADPAAIAAQAEVVRRVAVAVHALEEPFRTVVLLRFWHGLLPDAIAVRLGVPRNTVRSRLQRGLARLRERLDADGGRAQWAAPLGAFVGLREGAAGTAAVGGLVLAGVMMKTKVFAVVGVVLAAVWVMPAVWPGGGAAQQVDAGALGGAAVVVASAPTANVEAEAPLQREAAPVAVSAPAAAADMELPKAVELWPLRVLVVDGDGEPLQGATISVMPPPDRSRSTDAEPATSAAPVAILVAGAGGRASTMIALPEVRVVATHRDIASEPVAVAAGAAEAWIVVEPKVLLRGRVVRSDGRPWPDAEVKVEYPFAALAPVTVPVHSDAEGRFEIQVTRRAWGNTHVYAESNGRRSFSCQFRSSLRQLPELVLTEPGAHSIDGVVVDENGNPLVGAGVRALRVSAGAEDGPFERTEVFPHERTDAGGKFVVLVDQCGDYQLMASLDGLCSSRIAAVSVSDERPHARVDLSLPAHATIAGVVRLADGEPCRGVEVTASPDGPEPNADGGWYRFTGAIAKTDHDGRFALRVHPETTWMVEVWPVANQHEFAVQQPHIAAGRQDLAFTIDDMHPAQCTVQVQVEHDPVATPIDGFRFAVSRADPGSRRREIMGTASASAFALPALPIGLDYYLDVAPGLEDVLNPALAPVRHGPFRTAGSSMQITVPLVRIGQVQLTVLRADGSLARGAWCRLERRPCLFAWHEFTRFVDPDGVVRETQCVPGPNRLFVFGERGVLLERGVTIVPGLNPDLTVTLPATATPR